MTIERTVEIPANHRVYFDVPSHVPVGRARLTVRIDECPPGVGVETVEAFDTEDEATRFATRLAERVVHEAW